MIPVAQMHDAHAQASQRPKKKPKPFAWVNPLPDKHHPTLLHSTFKSKTAGQSVGYVIYLPPSYKQDSSRRYPVVYYLHGGRPGSEAKSIGLASLIDDEMKKDKSLEAIYVFVNGGPVSHYNTPKDDSIKQQSTRGADVFINELIPHIDSTYRTIASRRGRGLEGFSQGGRGTMRLSLRYPDLFCSAAAGGGGYETEKRISESNGFENEKLRFAKGDNTWDLARQYAHSENPNVSWMIYVGTKGFNYQNNLEYMKFLDSLGIAYQRLVVPDIPHSGKGIYEKEANRIVRFHAKNFAP